MVISATAPTMIVAAAIIRVLSGSLANAHPRNTATTGFTNAYVDTTVALTVLRSHRYAVFALIDQNVVR
jgi:hypothetical protein